MAEVVDWSPVDDDNDAAPPVGAPEGMMPSAVNNTMRAMMASLRRMYDQIVAGTLALPYLPLAGGTVTGNVAINGTGGVALGGTQLRNISSGLEVYNAGGGAITSRGPLAAVGFGDQNQTSPDWYWAAVNNVAYLVLRDTGSLVSVTAAGHLTTSSVSVSGAISGGNISAGSISATGNITSSSNIYATGYFSDGVPVIDSAAGNPIVYKSGGLAAIQLQATNTFYDNNGHLFRNAAGVNSFTIDNAGNIVTGGNISSTSVYAQISVNTGVFQTSIVCHGTIDAANYTRLGVPMFLMSEAQYDDITARLANLEAQLTQLRELSHV